MHRRYSNKEIKHKINTQRLYEYMAATIRIYNNNKEHGERMCKNNTL